MQQNHTGQAIGTNNGFGILECRDCGFAHLDPLPTQAQLDEIYPKEYYESHYPGWIEKTLSEREYWSVAFAERYKVFERLLPQNARRILDVGAFLGLFLTEGKARGWTTVGVEPSEQGCAYGTKNGIDMRRGFFQSFSRTDLGNFDVVNLSLTLEHVLSPAEVLGRAREVLSPGGLVSIEVPNDFSPIQKGVKQALQKPDYWLAAPHHINYFNHKTLEVFLNKMGFEVVHRTSTFPMEFFLMMGDDYLGNEQVGRQSHQRRMSFELNLKKAGMEAFREKFYEFLATQGVGREAVLTARKK